MALVRFRALQFLGNLAKISERKSERIGLLGNPIPIPERVTVAAYPLEGLNWSSCDESDDEDEWDAVTAPYGF